MFTPKGFRLQNPLLRVSSLLRAFVFGKRLLLDSLFRAFLGLAFRVAGFTPQGFRPKNSLLKAFVLGHARAGLVGGVVGEGRVGGAGGVVGAGGAGGLGGCAG